MIESLVAAALGVMTTAVVGSVVVSADRLRASAALDADLLAVLGKEHAAVVSRSMTRAATVAAIRSTVPAITLTEAAALTASLLGIPFYAATAASAATRWWWLLMAGVVAAALLVLYMHATVQWYRRAGERVSTYARLDLHNDAVEARQQADLALVVQGVLAAFSLVVWFSILGNRFHVTSVGESVMFFAAVAVATGATVLPRFWVKMKPASDASANSSVDANGGARNDPAPSNQAGTDG